MTTIVRDQHDRQEVKASSFETSRSTGSTDSPKTPSPNNLARIAGVFYVLLCASAWFALYVHDRTIKSGNAKTTADNIRKSSTLFRYGVMSDLMHATFFLFTAMTLYVLLKHINQLVAAAMVTIVAISVAIQSLNMLNQYTAMVIATSKGYTQSFGKEGADSMTLLFSDMQAHGFFIAQIFFGLWLLPLGYLVLKSGYFPKIFGYLLMLGCVTLLVELFAHFLAPGFADDIKPVLYPIGAIGEIPFFLWLLVKGVRTRAT